jgi:hypothetical protein
VYCRDKGRFDWHFADVTSIFKHNVFYDGDLENRIDVTGLFNMDCGQAIDEDSLLGYSAVLSC